MFIRPAFKGLMNFHTQRPVAQNLQIQKTLPTHHELEKIKNDKLIKRQYEALTKFFSFDPKKASEKNLIRLKNLLADDTQAMSAQVFKKDDRFLNGTTWSSHLREAERNIYNKIYVTLKHKTEMGDEIKKSQKMYSSRSLAENNIATERHTGSKDGIDQSLYFATGIGNHQAPDFLNKAHYLITVDLNKMYEQDPLVVDRLWVSGHLSEYESENKYFKKLGNVTFKIEHTAEGLIKTYTFITDAQHEFKWQINYPDEVFVAQDVIPGISLQFIYMLRLLGGEKNPLVKKLYQMNPESPQFLSLLEKLFSSLLPGCVYPEAKIIDSLDVDKDYINISIKSSISELSDNAYHALREAVETGEIQTVKALIKKGYPLGNEYNTSLLVAAFEIKDPNKRLAMLKELIKNGLNPMERHDGYGNAPLHTAASEGTAADLDLLLSSETPDRDEAMIRSLAHPDIECAPFTMSIDLIDTVLLHQEDTLAKLAVLKKHHANFKKYGADYLGTAIRKQKSAVISYLINETEAGEIINNCANQSPLMIACELGQYNTVTFLIEKGAKVNEQLRYVNYSPLTRNETLDDVSNGMTALHFAAKNGHMDIVTLLLEKGADLSLQTVEGLRPIDLVPADNIALKAKLKYQKKDEAENIAKNPADEAQQQKIASYDIHRHKVAVLLTGLREDGKRYVVLGKRQGEQDDNQIKNYCFPGGSADVKDLNMQKAALRELFEETSVDVATIPQAKITALGSFTGFKGNHDATHFFMVDVGSYPISPQACDDLAVCDRVLLEDLKIDQSKVSADYMQYQENAVLGSNALLISHCLLKNKIALRADEYASVAQQLLIEENGYYLLLDMLNQIKKGELKRGTSLWTKITSLLDNHVSLTRPHFRDPSLLTKMLELNCLEGFDLLIKYGAEIKSEQLEYAISANRLDYLKHLVELGAPIKNILGQRLLHLAVENGHNEILNYLLQQGLDPNRSYAYERRAGSLIVRPLIGLAIKSKQLALAKELLADDRIYLNRERSAKNRDTTLMTAIKADQKEMAKSLLASLRLNLQEMNRPVISMNNQEKSVDSLSLALTKNGWGDIAEIIDFLNHYTSFNDYLQAKNLPSLKQFVFSKDEKNNPTIHFYAQDEEQLKRLEKAIGLDCHRYHDDQGHYLRVGISRLEKLVGSRTIAQFLMDNLAHSIFWEAQSMALKALRTQLLSNKLEVLDLQMVQDILSLKEQATKTYFQRIIKENASITTVKLSINKDLYSELSWLMQAIKAHDLLSDVECNYDESKGPLSAASWQEIIDSLKSLSNLSTINFKHMPMSFLLDFFTQFKQDTDSYPEVTLDGDYPDYFYNQLSSTLKAVKWPREIIMEHAPQDKINEINNHIMASQIARYSKEDASFNKQADKITANDTLGLSLQLLHEEGNKNRILAKLIMQQSQLKNLNLDGYSDRSHQENKREVLQFLKTNKSLESIKLHNSGENFPQYLKVIAEANFKLKSLTINHALTAENIPYLVNILKCHPIRILKLSSSTIATQDVALLQTLSAAIAENTHLEVLNIRNIEISHQTLAEAFLSHLPQSKSLLAFNFSRKHFLYDSANIDESLPSFLPLMETLKRNTDAALSKPLSYISQLWQDFSRWMPTPQNRPETVREPFVMR